MRWPGRLKNPSGHWVKVKLVDRHAELDGDCAEYSAAERVISIADDTKPDTTWDSLLHEILHMAFYHAFGRLGRSRFIGSIRDKKTSMSDEEFEEIFVRRVTPKLYRILKDNFDFGPDKS